MLNRALHSVHAWADGSVGSLLQVVLQAALQMIGGQGNG